MIQEIVIQHVAPEQRNEYIKAFGDILLKNNYAGSHGIKFFTSIEDPSRVILMIEWTVSRPIRKFAPRRRITPCAKSPHPIKRPKAITRIISYTK